MTDENDKAIFMRRFKLMIAIVAGCVGLFFAGLCIVVMINIFSPLELIIYLDKDNNGSKAYNEYMISYLYQKESAHYIAPNDGNGLMFTIRSDAEYSVSSVDVRLEYYVKNSGDVILYPSYVVSSDDLAYGFERNKFKYKKDSEKYLNKPVKKYFVCEFDDVSSLPDYIDIVYNITIVSGKSVKQITGKQGLYKAVSR